MLSHALVVKIVAKVERSEDVAEFLAGALPLAQAESFTPLWFALRANATTFYIVDSFTSTDDRQKHLDGQIAETLMAKVSELLAEPPIIEHADVLASKLPA
ncbi:MAG: antibiotic biosynthesis monooxygenase [Cyanobacteria bacterium J06642_9]